MDWRQFLRTVTALAVILATLTPASQVLAADNGCQPADAIIGTCVTATVGDEDVTLGIDVTQPGSPQPPSGGGGDSTPVPEITACATPTPTGPCGVLGAGRDSFTITAPPAAPVTLSDIASFRPTTGISGMQPNGWMIVGLDTNFFSSARQQVVDGVLLGRPASVRFTPVGWRWTYGDDTSATVATPGAPWASLGLAEFSPTPGSHVYRAAGTYDIDLSVAYVAEYRFGTGGWTAIAGTLVVASNRLTASAGGATTVLVERECTLNPRGPGC